MIPFGNETVTLVHRTESTVNGRKQAAYSVEMLTGCSWRRTRQWVRMGEVLTPADAVTCRIPADQTRPGTGDLLILGSASVTVNSGADFQRLVEQYADGDGAFVAASVKDNARPGLPLPHWAVRS